MSRERILLVCPGRGTYNKAEWGYLQRHHANKPALLAEFDRWRQAAGQPTLSELDAGTPFDLKLHSRGDHASALILACAWADALDIDRERYEIVAVTGNSMGWYLALGLGGALDARGCFTLVNSMGRLMQESLIGGQLLQPWVDEDWRPLQAQRQQLDQLTATIHGQGGAALYPSIHLGGMRVFGGNAAGLNALEAELKTAGLAQGRFPMRLYNHAAFHTPLQAPVRDEAREMLGPEPFRRPELPLIDGRGQIWSPWSTDTRALWDYTLGHQLTAAYDFSRAIQVAVHEYAPDRLVITGPGTTLGGAVAQSLILAGWSGLKSKADFLQRQASDPVILSMGLPEQRALLQSG